MFRNLRVLIIEDDPKASYYIAKAFMKAGYTTLTHENRDAGHAVLKEFQPDLIVMDYLIPGMGAEAFLGFCKLECQNAKVIFLSDSKDAQSIAEQFKAEAFFQRPLVVDQLIDYANKITESPPPR